MSATVGDPSLAWSLLFSRQPEPDLEFTEEELEQTTNVRSLPPMKSPKKSGGRSLIWLLLLVLLGGGAYVAMEPELVTDLVGPLLGESSEPPLPTVSARPPQPKAPAPSTPPNQPGPAAAAPAAPQSQMPIAAAPAPEQTSSMPSVSVPAAPAPPPVPITAAQPTLAEPAPPSSASPAPLFAEGQRVTVLPSPAAPREKVTLKQDAAGTKPGPAVPPGTAFTILDGDLLDTGWVYYVRSDYGTKGWLEEKQLRLKP